MKSVAIGACAATALATAVAVPAAASPMTAEQSVRAGATSWRSAVSRPGEHRAVSATRTRTAKASATPKRVSTKRLVIRAVYASPATADVPDRAYSVDRVRVSGVWARARLTPKDPNALDPATAVLKRTRGTWKVVDLGSFDVGCGVAPRKARANLGLVCS